MLGFGPDGKITKAHVVGAAVGIGVVAVGYYLYKRNQNKVDDFLRNQGINVKSNDSANYDNMSVEALTEVKEHIEDLIAEKEANGEECCCACSAEVVEPEEKKVIEEDSEEK